MEKIIGETQSLCPKCMSRIPAAKVERHGNIYLKKECPTHGSFNVLIWRGDAKSFTDWEQFGTNGCPPTKTLTPSEKGCPYDCGLCRSHKVNACTMVLEVTSRCNLVCPVCFAGSGKGSANEPGLDTFKEMFQTVFDSVGPCTIQISGGEPTLRDDLPRIIALGRKIGFDHILLNTNGIRFAKDIEYIRRLKESGLSAVYLQFDGVSDDVYRFIRGKNLLGIKTKAIDNCANERMGVVLVPVLIPKINYHQIGDIFRFAKERIPIVRGIHFQPISYLGRYPAMPLDEDRMTIPDVLNALVKQTNGELQLEDFLPRGVKSSHCSFSAAYVLTKDGRINPLYTQSDRFLSQHRKLQGTEESSRQFMSRYWRFYDEHVESVKNPCCKESGCDQKPETEPLFKRIITHSMTISCMPFQDIWNIDLNRLMGCCGHVVTPNRRIIPFCALYLTDANGQRLYTGDQNGEVLLRDLDSQ